MKRISFLLLMTCKSCTIVYHPNTRHLPMFSGKGEFQGSTSISMNGEWNVHSAYAVSDHVGIVANGMRYHEKVDKDLDRGSLIELGAGYYTNKKEFYYDVFAGYGIGQLHANYDSDFLISIHTRTEGSFQRYFIQPSFALKEKNFHAGFATRLSYLDFSSLTQSNDGQPAVSPYGYRFFLEPAVIAKYYYKKCYFMVQPSLNMSISDDKPVINTIPFLLHFGIGVRF